VNKKITKANIFIILNRPYNSLETRRKIVRFCYVWSISTRNWNKCLSL